MNKLYINFFFLFILPPPPLPPLKPPLPPLPPLLPPKLPPPKPPPPKPPVFLGAERSTLMALPSMYSPTLVRAFFAVALSTKSICPNPLDYNQKKLLKFV